MAAASKAAAAVGMQLRPWRHTTQMMSSSARDAAEAIASLSESRSETCSQTIALIVRARTPVVSRAAGAVQRCLSFLVMITMSTPAAGARSHFHARADIARMNGFHSPSIIQVVQGLSVGPAPSSCICIFQN